MTVRELLDELEHLPGDALVAATASAGGVMIVVQEGDTDIAGFDVPFVAP